ncbi:MAG: HAD family hydrolase [Proteobacteria bacterium]|nr:HAD family hydrolase [Pseudomonadota bacterium]MBU1739993.1 HAD family hydrolase [Pseudomonadota bacterium]
MADRAVFLDRDGTLNEQMGYINHPSRLVILPGVSRAVRRLNQAGFKVVVISNQSGVARGYFPEKLVDEVNQDLAAGLAGEGARLDGVYVCLHHPSAEVPAYAVDCDCRKPKPGLILRAARELDLELKRSYAVGDRLADVDCAWRAGVRGILVRTGYGRGEEKYLLPATKIQPDFVAEDLSEAVDWILANQSES